MLRRTHSRRRAGTPSSTSTRSHRRDGLSLVVVWRGLACVDARGLNWALAPGSGIEGNYKTPRCATVWVMSSPLSIRFDEHVLERLAAYASTRPGVSTSGAAARLVDEGLRMDAHKGVIFRDGPSGRRAVLIGGPDVWEVIRVVRLTRQAEPGYSEAELLNLVSTNSGVSPAIIQAALAYYAEWPDEVRAIIAQADAMEQELEASQERVRELLSS